MTLAIFGVLCGGRGIPINYHLLFFHVVGPNFGNCDFHRNCLKTGCLARQASSKERGRYFDRGENHLVELVVSIQDLP